MNTPRNTPAVRILRIAALSVVSIALALIFTQALASISAPVQRALVALLGIGFLGGDMKFDEAALTLVLVAMGFLAAILLAVWRLKLNSWGRIAVGAAAVAGMLVYMAHDDPSLRRPIMLDEFSPAFPGAEQSFKVLMRYGRSHPLAKNFKVPTYKEPYPNLGNREPGPWRAMLSLHRSEFEANWQQLAPERAWWNELNSFDSIGDLTAPRFDSEVISFQVLRAVSQNGIGIASLKAIDGHGDEAVDTLLPILQVARKLQPSSRTLVRSMIGVVIERLGLETAAFILDTTPVSPAARLRLVDALRGGDPETGARHLIGCEYALSLNTKKDSRMGDFVDVSGPHQSRVWIARTLQLLSPFVYNPRATFNLAGDVSADLQDIVGRRELAKLDPRTERFIKEEARPRFKNLLGLLLLQQITPAYTKVSENYWRTQDLRAALLTRLKTA